MVYTMVYTMVYMYMDYRFTIDEIAHITLHHVAPVDFREITEKADIAEIAEWESRIGQLKLTMWWLWILSR